MTPGRDLSRVETAVAESTILLYDYVADDHLVFVPEERAREVESILSAKTWGELRARVSPTTYSWFWDEYSDNEEPADDVPFDFSEFDESGDMIFLEQEMLEWMPGDIVDQFGSVVATTLSGDRLDLRDDQLVMKIRAGEDDGRSPLLDALGQHGFTCVRGLLDSICGYA